MPSPITADSATLHVVLELPDDAGRRGELLSLLVDLGIDNLKITGGGAVDFELYGRVAECFEKWQRIAAFDEDSSGD